MLGLKICLIIVLGFSSTNNLKIEKNHNYIALSSAQGKRKVVSKHKKKIIKKIKKRTKKRSKRKSPITKPLKIIHHKPFNKQKLWLQPFEKIGCQPDKNKGWLNCESHKIGIEYKCDKLRIPSDYIAYLKPKYALVECISKIILNRKKLQEQLSEFGEYIRIIGYPDRVGLIRFIIWQDGWKLLKSREDFKRAFAPIESEPEALAYAAALTGDEARYDIKIPKGYQIMAKEIEDTYVEKVSQGYMVNLFRYYKYGCDTHPVFSIKYFVSIDGEIKLKEKKKIYLNPMETGKCLM